jgi:hypothetical protein
MFPVGMNKSMSYQPVIFVFVVNFTGVKLKLVHQLCRIEGGIGNNNSNGNQNYSHSSDV